MTIVLKPEAAVDLADASAWYDQQRSGLGIAFIGAVEATFTAIGQRPLLFGKVRGELRRALVRRFPNCVFYMTDGASVTIYAVLHQRRSPAVWRTRVEGST